MSIENATNTQRDPARSAGVSYAGNQASTGPKWILPTIVATVMLIFFLMIGFLIMRYIGAVSGEEFSPDAFDRRTFAYNKMPLTGWIVSKREIEDYTDPLSQHLITGGFIKPVKNDPQTWHLVRDSKTSSNSVDFDARFLTNILDMRNADNELVWLNWTMSHTQCAKILWPEVARLARDEEYWAIPDLVDLASTADESKSAAFQQQVAAYTSNIYRDEAQRLIDDEQYESALYYLDQAIEVQPSAEAYRMRAGVHGQLGNTAEQNQDLASAVGESD